MTPTQRIADPLLIGYLDAIVALTCQREAQGLSASLIDSLCQHVRAERFRLLALSRFNNDTHFAARGFQDIGVRDCLDPLSAPIPIVNDADLLACVRSKARVSRVLPGAGGHRLVLAIFGARGVAAMLAIEGTR